MKYVYCLCLFVFVMHFNLSAQNSGSCINSTAYSSNQLSLSVGEIFVIPVDTSPASSGMLGVQTNVIAQTVNLDEIQQTDELVYFPNPVTDYLYIKSSADNSKMAYEVFDLTGSLVLKGTDATSKINLSNLKTASYIIHLQNAVHKYSIKIIKQ